MKRLFCVLLTLLMAISLALPCFAAVTDNSSDYDKTQIEDDLKNYDLSGYVKNKNDRGIYLIDFFENGYSKRYGHQTDEFSLYLYLYNPSCLITLDKVDPNTYGGLTSSIQFASSWSKDKEGNLTPTDYYKISMTLVDYTDDRLFLKYKVDAPQYVLYLEKDIRYYGISGIELTEVGNVNAVDYKVGYIYKFSGYLEDDTYAVNRSSLTTIDIECHQTSYLTGDSSKGENYSNQVNSVFFNIPNSFSDRFGELFKIDFSYYEVRTSPMILCSDEKSYQKLLDTRGMLSSDITDFALYKILYQYQYGIPALPVCGIKQYGAAVVFSFSKTYIKESEFPFLTTFFYVPSLSEDHLYENLVSAQEIAEYFKRYPVIGDRYVHTGTIRNGLMSKDLFEGDLKHVVTSKTVDDVFNMPSYADTHSFWDALFDCGLRVAIKLGSFDNSIVDEKYIVEVKGADLYSNTTADDLLINEDDITRLRTVYNASPDDKTYLLRYAVTDDYYSTVCFSTGLDGEFLMVLENVYLDFDIISFTFKDNETLTVIPVVSSPTDGYTPIKDTDYDSVADELIKDDFESLIESIKKFFKIFVLIVGVIILIALIPIFISFVNLIVDFFAGATKTVSDAFKKEPKIKAPRSSSARYKRRRK